jgi:hypothetical protein
LPLLVVALKVNDMRMLRLVGEKCGVDRECCKCPSYYLKNLSLERGGGGP